MKPPAVAVGVPNVGVRAAPAVAISVVPIPVIPKTESLLPVPKRTYAD